MTDWERLTEKYHVDHYFDSVAQMIERVQLINDSIRPKFREENPELVNSFLQSILEAAIEGYIHRNFSEVKEMIIEQDDQGNITGRVET